MGSVFGTCPCVSDGGGGGSGGSAITAPSGGSAPRNMYDTPRQRPHFFGCDMLTLRELAKRGAQGSEHPTSKMVDVHATDMGVYTPHRPLYPLCTPRPLRPLWGLLTAQLRGHGAQHSRPMYPPPRDRHRQTLGTSCSRCRRFAASPRPAPDDRPGVISSAAPPAPLPGRGRSAAWPHVQPEPDGSQQAAGTPCCTCPA